jgi:hypothetical protein
MELTMGQRQAVKKKKALPYQSADRSGKSRILNELNGWHRDYGTAVLSSHCHKSSALPRNYGKVRAVSL